MNGGAVIAFFVPLLYNEDRRDVSMNYPICADLHTHTLASGHAYGTIREMAHAAAGCGLALLGLTEHAPGIPGTADPMYYRNLAAVPRELYGVHLLHGCEINVLTGGRLSLEQRYIDLLDYAIAGIHRQCYENEGIVGNTDNLIACMRNEKVCLVSHPDDNTTPLDYPALVQAAKAYHVALEVNNSSLRKPQRRLGCVENYRALLALCAEYDVPVVVSSDAHDPSAVGGFSLALALLEGEEFDPALVLNTDATAVLRFFGLSA